VDRNDRVLYLSTGRGCCVSYPDFEDWRAQARSFVGMVLVHGIPKTFSDSEGFPQTYNTTEVSAETFKLAGQTPILGRDFLPSDEIPGAPPVVILRHSFWERRYGKAPSVIGRTVRINGAPTTVIGIMPRGFSFPQNADLWCRWYLRQRFEGARIAGSGSSSPAWRRALLSTVPERRWKRSDAGSAPPTR